MLGSLKILLIIGLLFYTREYSAPCPLRVAYRMRKAEGLTVIVMCGGNPQHHAFGFQYWKNPGPFVEYIGTGAAGRFAGFWSVFVQAAYAFGTPDFLAYAAGEAKYPRRIMPSVFSRVIYRLIAFYVLGALATGIVVGLAAFFRMSSCDTLTPRQVPSNEKALKQSLPGAGSSPFVISAKALGIPFLPGFINALVLSSAWSCGFEICFATTRSLYGLAIAGQAPRIFKFTWRGTPTFCVIFCTLIGCLCFLTVSSNSTVVFTWITKLVGTFVFTDIILIHITYLRFTKGLRAQGIDASILPFRRRGQVWVSWASIVAFSVLLLVSEKRPLERIVVLPKVLRTCTDQRIRRLRSDL